MMPKRIPLSSAQVHSQLDFYSAAAMSAMTPCACKDCQSIADVSEIQKVQETDASDLSTQDETP